MAKGTKTVRPKDRVLNVKADPPDLRDRIYKPALIPLEPTIEPPGDSIILDQGREGACTGFALAAAINFLLDRQSRNSLRASPRMLYEMAKRHDEWPGQDYDGSSCRGAIRGWSNMGVCADDLWPYDANRPDDRLTIERARAARSTTLGAYYRLRPNVTDYHAALNEVGVLYVSAKVHEGWFAPKGTPSVIRPGSPAGGHAFAIVGYNDHGFWVQNSWGPDWGQRGHALWPYEDWLANVTDGWAVRLALPVPQIFGLTAKSSETGQDAEVAERRKRKPPKRSEIAGHFIHFDDGKLKERGDYWSTLDDVKQTADLIKAHDYKHLLIYAHGGLNSPKASATRIRALKHGFKRNGVYPVHIMYDTGLAEELGDVVRRALGLSEERAGGFLDWTDKIIEDAVRKPVTPIWEEMKRDARLPFAEKSSDGSQSIRAFAETLAGTGTSINIAGHSTGGVLIGHLLAGLDKLDMPVPIKSLTLFAPACRVEFFEQTYVPYLDGKAGKAPKVENMLVYNLNDELEQDDQVAYAYRKSLLYLVSRALERDKDRPLLGMEDFSKKIATRPNLEFVYSNGRGRRSASKTHGGFDNDVNTMNDLLKTILGKKPRVPFSKEEMKGY